ncbi:MAG: allophanate hydrolase [Verrucomicrobiales bacterium]|nr:allophanate hydrolase [Verrucomicrobiales bacterium]
MIDDLSILSLHQLYRDEALTPGELVAALRERIEASDPKIWIALTPDDRMESILRRLETESPDSLPLYGVPFAIKDNIDLGGTPTTAACPNYAFTPDKDATVVSLLIEAGAIPMGKTNLDQFATGLVGVRSPYGVPENPFNGEFIPGGSSSGSAVAVARDLCTFSLGTDTAGSGRVPAGLNELVGLKPSFGRLSCSGVVPACRSLDCVSIFSKIAADAKTVFDVAAAFDSADAYSREPDQTPWFPADAFTFGVPRADQLKFFGNKEAEHLFAEAVARLESLGGTQVEIDFSAFLEAALLLYEGPWVSERYAAIQGFIEEQPESLFPVTEAIISGGGAPKAVDAFRAQYRLRALKQRADALMATLDLIVTPTAGTAYTVAEVEADPVALNSNLGYYTNFMNLLDLSACAVPAGRLAGSGMPWGITLVGPAFADHALLTLADRFAGTDNLPLEPPAEWIEIVVCGAHMRGLPLNHQLTDRGARFVSEAQTASCYQLLALPPEHGLPPRPGLIRRPEEDEVGNTIEIEIWTLPASKLGSFVAAVPPPLGFGKVRLNDNRLLTGFLCESEVPEESVDITPLGGWRNYLNQQT